MLEKNKNINYSLPILVQSTVFIRCELSHELLNMIGLIKHR